MHGLRFRAPGQIAFVGQQRVEEHPDHTALLPKGRAALGGNPVPGPSAGCERVVYSGVNRDADDAVRREVKHDRVEHALSQGGCQIRRHDVHGTVRLPAAP